jgi:hypothetical protein
MVYWWALHLNLMQRASARRLRTFVDMCASSSPKAAHVELLRRWAIAEMIRLNAKGLGTFRGPLLPLAYIRPNDRYPHHGMHFSDKLRPTWVELRFGLSLIVAGRK